MPLLRRSGSVTETVSLAKTVTHPRPQWASMVPWKDIWRSHKYFSHFFSHRNSMINIYELYISLSLFKSSSDTNGITGESATVAPLWIRHWNCLLGENCNPPQAWMVPWKDIWRSQNYFSHFFSHRHSMINIYELYVSISLCKTPENLYPLVLRKCFSDYLVPVDKDFIIMVWIHFLKICKYKESSTS